MGGGEVSAVDQQVRARFGGHVTVASYELGSPIFLDVEDSVTGSRILHEFGPSNARALAAALFAAANVAEGKEAVSEAASA